jgi:glycosyltransferase involved in cell wall biosynthesis
MWWQAHHYAEPLDAVHAIAFPYAFLAACGLKLARRRKVPFFLTPFLHFGDRHNRHDPIRKAYTRFHLRWLLRQADGVFVQTAVERDVVVSCGVDPQRVHLQGLGVEPTECTGGDRASTRRTWGINDQTVVIGHLANLSWEKGTVDLLKAVQRLQQQNWPCLLVLAGPTMPNFRHIWTQHPWPAARYLGVLTPEQKRDFFAAIDLLALPSRTDSFGLVLLEAWANSKPVVAWHAGGPGELIHHQQDGLLARCGDLEQLTNHFAYLIQHPQQRLLMGTRGQQRIATEFRWVDKLERVRQVMAEAVTRS